IKDQGVNVILVSYDKKLIGFLGLIDELRPKVKETLAELKNFGVEKEIMLTGDNEKVAEKIAQELNLDDYYANLLPEDKIKFVKKYINKKYKVAMIGDGINDAAVLALADIGIAMGAIGSDAAIESADIALMKDDFSKLIDLFKLSFFVNKIAYEDILIWAIVNIFGLIFVFNNIIGPQGAAAYNFLTDFLPFFNSLRLFNLHLKNNLIF
ncbi:MAG: HAD-IC family P-type ATPase, partial [Minisyncoccia bacterium]